MVNDDRHKAAVRSRSYADEQYRREQATADAFYKQRVSYWRRRIGNIKARAKPGSYMERRLKQIEEEPIMRSKYTDAVLFARRMENDHLLYTMQRPMRGWHGVIKCYRCDLTLRGTRGYSYLAIHDACGDALEAIPPCTTRQGCLYD